MSERELPLLLEDVQIAIETIFQFIEGYSFEKYDSDLKTKHAVERNFEIISEAVARIPDEYKLKHPQIEWRIIKDFRNFIIHDYFGVNNQIVWDTIQFQLPDLLEKIIGVLSKEVK